MTYPGFQAQQAAQVAAQQAVIRASLDTARYGQQRANQAMNYAYRRGAVRTGVGVVGRFIGFVISMAIIGFVLVIFAMVLEQADPHLFNHLVSSIHRLF